MKFLKVLLIVLASLAAVVVIFFGILTVTEFSPEEQQDAKIISTSQKKLTGQNSFKIVTWNTGYGCLGESADFFMDGGKGVKTASKEQSLENLKSISSFLKTQNADFIFLQETDFNSTRSSGVNQTEYFSNEFSQFASAFAQNFKTLFIPYPVPPIGKVDSGLLTLSRFTFSSAVRKSLPCPFSYPVRLCNLKRCLLISRIPLEQNDRELVLINLHLEAYDDGEGKKAQTKILLDVLKSEKEKGNYVIAGGDFNQTFSGIKSDKKIAQGLWTPGILDESEFKDFILLMDSNVPSCRSLDRPFDGSDDFAFYIIDGFIVSKNISVISVCTHNLQFKNSDHNPVVMEFSFN